MRYLENFGDNTFEHRIDATRHLAQAQLRLGEWQFLRGAKLYRLRSPNQQNNFLYKVLLNLL